MPTQSKSSVTASILLFSLTIACAAQQGTHLNLRIDENRGLLINPLSAPFEVLLLEAAPDGSVLGHQIVRIESKSSVPVMPGAYIKDKNVLMPIASPIIPTCENGHPFITLTPSRILTDLNSIDKQDEEHQKRSETLAAYEGELRMAQTFDEVETQRNDPLSQQLMLQRQESETPQQLQQDNAAFMGQYYFNTGREIASGVMEVHDALAAHAAAAGEQAAHLKQMLSDKQAFLNKAEAGISQIKNMVNIEREFNAAVARDLASSVPGTSETRATEFGRLCTGPAFYRDTLALKVDAPGNTAVLLGTIHFDREGNEDVIFRRISGTPQWIATMWWPPDAKKGTVALKLGKEIKLGEIQSGRKSAMEEMSDVRKAMGKLKRDLHDASFSAKGGDEARTTVIP